MFRSRTVRLFGLLLLLAITTFVAVSITRHESPVQARSIPGGLYNQPVQFETVEEAETEFGVSLVRPRVPEGVSQSLILGSENPVVGGLMIQQNWTDSRSNGGILFFEQHYAEGEQINRSPQKQVIEGQADAPDRYVRTRFIANVEYAAVALLDGPVTTRSIDELIMAIR